MDDDLPVSPQRPRPERARRRAGESTRVVRASADADGSREIAPEPRPVPRRRQPENDDPTEIISRRAAGEQRRAERRTAAGAGGGGSSEVPVQRGRGRGRRPRRGLAVLIVLLVLGLIASPFLYVACQGLNSIHNIKREAGLLPEGDRADKKVDGALTILLAGHDKPDPGSTTSRSDSMMLVHFPKDRKHIYVISLPRDMWVPVPGKQWSKLNAAFAEGGAALTVKTFESYMDIHIDHVAMMDFEGFIRLTEALGGVTVHNKIASTEAGGKYVYPEGDITIEGDAALAYVRQRKELENGDLDRAERQRAVVKGIVSKALSAGVLTNPSKLTEFMDKASKTVTLDDTFSDGDVRSLILSMEISSGSDVRTMMAPIAGFDERSKVRGAIDVVDEAKLKELAEAIQADTMDAYWDANPKPPVLTGRFPPGGVMEGDVPEKGLSLTELAQMRGTAGGGAAGTEANQADGGTGEQGRAATP